MNRDEFEIKYAQKYMGLSFVHNPPESIESIKELRDGEGYTDHHIDIWWKIWKIQDLPSWERSLAIIDLEM